MNNTIRIDLTEQLGEGQYVEIRNPKLLPWGVQRELTSALKDNSLESQTLFAEKLAVRLIKSGYVLNEDGQPISFPLTDESVQFVPGVVVEAVASEFAKIRSKGADLPNV